MSKISGQIADFRAISGQLWNFRNFRTTGSPASTNRHHNYYITADKGIYNNRPNGGHRNISWVSWDCRHSKQQLRSQANNIFDVVGRGTLIYWRHCPICRQIVVLKIPTSGQQTKNKHQMLKKSMRRMNFNVINHCTALKQLKVTRHDLMEPKIY